MMAPCAIALGFELRVLAEGRGRLGGRRRRQGTRSATTGTWRRCATSPSGLDVLTFDHEHVPTEHLQALIAEGVNVQPHPDALIHAQDKLRHARG